MVAYSIFEEGTAAKRVGGVLTVGIQDEVEDGDKNRSI